MNLPVPPDGPTLDQIVADLRQPANLPRQTTTVDLKETHISVVVLADDRVYKLKKHLKFPFVDYTTLEKRKAACEEEVRLNRRLAPQVYLGVLPVTRTERGYQLGGDGDVVDYCVEMQRLPEDRMLDRLLVEEAAGPEDRQRLLKLLVAFHETADRDPVADAHNTPDAITAHVQGNLDVLEHHRQLPGHCFGRIRSSQLQYIALHRDLLTSRIRQGKICDGHGDLRPEHVCLIDPPVIYDCVEFSKEFRAGDVISEISFLAMECDFLHAKQWGSSLIPEYLALTNDPCPETLPSFYKAYRACVRAKVEMLRAEQEANPDASQIAMSRAGQYAQLASFYASEFHKPLLLITVGISGSGKSHLARRLEKLLGLTWLRTDAIRQELAGRRDPDAKFREGIYSAEMTARTYEQLFAQATELLKDANTVLLDGTFTAGEYRDRARKMANELGLPVWFLYLDLPVEVAIHRVGARREAGDDISDAAPTLPTEQHFSLAAEAVDLNDPDVIRLDATQPIDKILSQVVQILSRQVHT